MTDLAPLYETSPVLRVEGTYGGGQLTVVAGLIYVRPSRVTRALGKSGEVRWSDSVVRLTRPRLTPPWFRFSLMLDGCVAIFPFWERRRLCEALHAAGFEVRVRRTWLLFGDGWIFR